MIELFAEIASLGEGNYSKHQYDVFVMLNDTLNSLFPSPSSYEEVYRIGGSLQLKFINKLAVCFSTYMRVHFATLVYTEDQVTISPVFKSGFEILLALSYIDDVEVYKSCLEFWLDWATYLVTIMKSSLVPPNNQLLQFSSYINQLTHCIITNMARPEEVIVVETESGDVIREFMKDTAAIDHYHQCRLTLTSLTQIDPSGTRNIMESIMLDSVSGIDFTWKKVNTLCWSVGSISGAFNIEDERRFIVLVIRELLALCEKMSGKNNKALVAANIMYVVRKYPRFLNSYWKFLCTVVNKLFEFMHELHEGVQDMACDTFLKISQKCAYQFVIEHENETGLFVEKICSRLTRIICDLEMRQVHVVYNSVGYMINSCPIISEKERILQLLLENSNNQWIQIIQKCRINNDYLFEIDTLQSIVDILKLNSAVSSSLDDVYQNQMNFLHSDLSDIYKILSEKISYIVMQQGDNATKLVIVKKLRSVKRETLKLLEICIKNASDLNTIINLYVPFIVQTVLPDYELSVAGAKDAELLNLLDTLVCKLKIRAQPFIPAILKYTFNSTVNLIDKDFMEYPEHRRYFFKLLESISSSCFTALMELPQQDMDLVINCVIWAFKHTMPDVAETGLQVLFKLFNNFAHPQYSSLDISQQFFKTYYISMMTHILSIITDSTQASVIEFHARIIASMITILESNILQFPLFPDVDGNTANNILCVKNYLVQLIGNAFSNLSEEQVRVFIEGLFALSENKDKFVIHLIDFILQTKVMQSQGSKDIYIDEYISELKSELVKKNQQLNNSLQNQNIF